MAQLSIPHATDPNLPTYRIHCHASQGVPLTSNTKNNLRFTLPPLFPVNDLDATVARIGLTQAYIPCSWYNITSASGNNTIEVKISDGADLKLTLADGQYDIDTIIDDWNNYTTRLVMGFDTTTNKVTFTFKTDDAQYHDFLYAVIQDQKINKQLGILANDKILATKTYYGAFITNMKYTDNILVCFQEVQPTFLSSTFQFQNSSSCLAVIPANYSFGEEIFYEPFQMHYHENRNFLLTSLTISLLDDSGTPIDFNGQDWSVIFEVDYVLAENIAYNHPSGVPQPVITRNNPLSSDRLIRNLDLGAPLYLSRK